MRLLEIALVVLVALSAFVAFNRRTPRSLLLWLCFADLLMLGNRFRAACAWREFSASDHADADLHLSYIHATHLLIDDLVFDGTLGVCVQLTFGNICGRAVIACW